MFDALLARTDDQRHRFTVYRSGEPTAIEDWFTSHGVAVDSVALPAGGPEPFIEVEYNGDCIGVVGINELERLLEPPIIRPTGSGVSAAYRVIFDLLDDTLFSSLNRRELLAVSQEIEERAYRVGSGTFRVGFQTFSTFQSQVDLYQVLATETDLDIHIYGSPDWTPPGITGITYHEDSDGNINQYWALAFDGGGNSQQMCGLLAQEQATGYRGWWTNEAETVDEMLRTFELLDSS